MKVCNIDGCDKKSSTKNMCQSHYNKWLRKNRNIICTIENCNKKESHKGLCGMHNARKRRNGSPLYSWEPWKYKDICYNNTNVIRELYFERVDKPKYDALHKRIRTVRGRATSYICIDCGKQAHHWSLNMDCEHEYVMYRGLTKAVSYDIMDYDPRCRQCHSIYDREYMRQGAE